MTISSNLNILKYMISKDTNWSAQHPKSFEGFLNLVSSISLELFENNIDQAQAFKSEASKRLLKSMLGIHGYLNFKKDVEAPKLGEAFLKPYNKLAEKFETNVNELSEHLTAQGNELQSMFNAVMKLVHDTNKNYVLKILGENRGYRITLLKLSRLSEPRQRLITKTKVQACEELKSLIEDRVVANVKDFSYARAKPGVTTGYIAKRNADSHLFAIKSYFRNPVNQTDCLNNCRFLNEFVLGPFYQRWLYKRAPRIILIASNYNNEVLLGSKFLPSFQTASEFTGNTKNGELGNENLQELKRTLGAERLMSVIFAGGEYDAHFMNFGPMEDSDSKVRYFGKIDHGESTFNYFTKHEIMWKSICRRIYLLNMMSGLTIDVTKLRDDIAEVCNITDDEIEFFVRMRIELLKGQGIDFSAIRLFYYNDMEDPTVQISSSKTVRSQTALEWHYIGVIRNLIGVTLALSDNYFSVVERMEKPDDWKKSGQWIKDINGEEPRSWAKRMKVKIKDCVPCVQKS